jgi:hypothetical protein
MTQRSGINLDPHDEATLPAAESLTGKQGFMVTINEKGEVKLAKAGEVAFPLINEPENAGESASFVAPLQFKGKCGEELKPGWKVKVNNAGELVKATEEKHVVGVVIAEGVVASGGLITVSFTPAGCTG